MRGRLCHNEEVRSGSAAAGGDSDELAAAELIATGHHRDIGEDEILITWQCSM